VATYERFEDLPVWREARTWAGQIYQLTRKGPFRDDWGLSQQIQRAAVSVMSNVAEGFERGSNREFIRYLFIAKGSTGEVRSQLYLALDLDYITQSEFQAAHRQCISISQQLGNFIGYLKNSEYQGAMFKEDKAPYQILESFE